MLDYSSKKRKQFNKICDDIKTIKIQGARNIAKAALKAYNLIPTRSSKEKLLSLRPTEPMLSNVLRRINGESYEKLIKHFDESQEKINKFILRLIKKEDVVFTHCHSTNVVNALIYAKKHGKKFQVYNTETRPIFQGRKTAEELGKSGIKVTMFVDSATMIALTKKQGAKKVDKVFLGADALLKEGVINKVGSGMLSKIAYDNKIPVYIIADSWKYSPQDVKLEERNFHEVWEDLLKSPRIKIRNPAFEFVPREYIKAIVFELGILRYNDFVKKVE